MKNKSYKIIQKLLFLSILVTISIAPIINNVANAANNNILNPSVEESSGSLPTYWRQNKWGINNAMFSYPVEGTNGSNSKAIQVKITRYPKFNILHLGGDAKWYFDLVSVTPGQKYVFSDKYKSTIKTFVVAELHSAKGVSYLDIGNANASSNWQTFSAGFTVPSNVTSLTIFHLINAVGTLTTDEYSLVNQITATNPIPTTTSINPNSKTAGSTGFDITVNGTNFISTSVVNFNGSGRSTAFNSATQLTATIPATDLVNPGSYNITITNPSPGGGTSNAISFTITPVIPPPPPPPLGIIPNPSLEDQTGTLPTYWHQGQWGTNTAIFTYPVEGTSGSTSKAIKVEITTYPTTDLTVGGDAKWYFDLVSVTPEQYYVFKDAYKSTTATHVVVEFHNANGTLSYQEIGVPAPSSNWQTFSAGFTVPSNVTSLTIFHLINAVGTLTTDEYSLVASTNPNAFSKGLVTLSFDDGWKSIYDNGIPILNASGIKSTQYIITQANPADGYMTTSQLYDLANQGHEITAHTRNHLDLTKLSSADLQSEVNGSKTDLQNLGFSPVNNLAYPYGQYNNTVEQSLKDAGFLAGRTVNFGFNDKATNNYELKGTAVTKGGVCNSESVPVITLNDVKGWVDTAVSSKTWLILVFHQIDTDNANCYGITPTLLQGIVDYLKTVNVNVVTVDQGLNQKINP